MRNTIYEELEFSKAVRIAKSIGHLKKNLGKKGTTFDSRGDDEEKEYDLDGMGPGDTDSTKSKTLPGKESVLFIPSSKF